MILLRLLIVLFALIGTPLFVIIAAATLLAFYKAGIDFTAIMIEICRIAHTPILMAIPLFAFAGTLLAESNAPNRIVRFSRAAFGWCPGGLAIVVLFTCAFFTVLTGASGVTILAIGNLLFPVLLKEGYSEKFSLGLITASGSLGLLFPPSLPLIIYGVIAKVSIDKLFLAGVLPGIFLIGLFASFCVIEGLKLSTSPFSINELFAATKDAIWELVLPFIILGGIYSGKFALSEAAAVTAFYILIIEIFVKRDIKVKKLFYVIRQSMILVGSIIIILACALAFTNYLIDAEIPMKILIMLKSYIKSKILFLIFLNIFLLIVGCMMDIFSALLIVVPLIIPIAQAYNVNLIHLGIIFLTNLEIGYITPPVGINLFVSSLCFEKTILRLYLASFPFFLILLLGLLIITYVPNLSLFLVRLGLG